MKKKITMIIMLFCFWNLCLSAAAQDSQKGSVIVCVRQQKTRSIGSPLLQQAKILMEIQTNDKKLSRQSSRNEKQILMEVTVEGRTTESLIQELEGDPNVVFVEANQPIYAQTASDYPDFTKYQWSCQNKGQQSGIAGIDIGYEQWNKNSTKAPVVVAVMDTGIDYTHPDLKDKMWHKSANAAWASLPGGEYGWNVYASYEGADETNIMDDHWHGTHCSGIIGAAWDQHGISGIASNIQLMGVKILNNKNRGMLSDAIRGYNYLKQACELGVNIKAVNNSWSNSVPSEALNAAILELGRLNVVSVFASGNDGKNLDQESDIANAMKENPYVIFVNAMEPDGTMASFSNYSTIYTNIAAPGTGILSTVPLNQAQYLPELAKQNLFDCDFETKEDSIVFLNNEAIVGQTTITERFQGKHSMVLPMKSESISFYTQAVSVEQSSEKIYISMHLKSDTKEDLYIKLWVKNQSGEWIPVSDSFSDTIIRFGVWGHFSVALPEDTDYDQFQLKIDLNTYTDSYPDNVYVDTLGIGTECYPYNYANGTSMAAPVVTAQAAILSQIYEEQADCLAARIIGSAIPLKSLENTNCTGGFASMKNTASPSPVILKASQTTEEYLEINGHFLGDHGTITMDNMPLEVMSWNEHSIVACLPQNVEKHMAKIVITLEEKVQKDLSVMVQTKKLIPELSYRAHVQNIGWQGWIQNGEMAGTKGRSLRVEALEIRCNNILEDSNLIYRVHVQNIGWQNWVQNGEMAGTKGKSLRVEALEVKLVGQMEQQYHIAYRAHVQNIGWQDWVQDGEMAGTKGKSLRIEAIQIRLIKK